MGAKGKLTDSRGEKKQAEWKGSTQGGKGAFKGWGERKGGEGGRERARGGEREK